MRILIHWEFLCLVKSEERETTAEPKRIKGKRSASAAPAADSLRLSGWADQIQQRQTVQLKLLFKSHSVQLNWVFCFFKSRSTLCIGHGGSCSGRYRLKGALLLQFKNQSQRMNTMDMQHSLTLFLHWKYKNLKLFLEALICFSSWIVAVFTVFLVLNAVELEPFFLWCVTVATRSFYNW